MGGEDQPLSFGRSDGRGLEESQLEDVMKGRRELLNRQRGIAPLLQQRGLAEVAFQAYTGPCIVPDELSVDRYDDLVDGGCLFEQHMAELDATLRGGPPPGSTVDLGDSAGAARPGSSQSILSPTNSPP